MRARCAHVAVAATMAKTADYVRAPKNAGSFRPLSFIRRKPMPRCFDRRRLVPVGVLPCRSPADPAHNGGAAGHGQHHRQRHRRPVRQGNVTSGGTAISNPPGSDETRGIIELDLSFFDQDMSSSSTIDSLVFTLVSPDGDTITVDLTAAMNALHVNRQSRTHWAISDQRLLILAAARRSDRRATRATPESGRRGSRR